MDAGADRRRRAARSEASTPCGSAVRPGGGERPLSTLDSLRAQLEAVLGRAVTNLTPLTGGASRATYSFDAQWPRPDDRAPGAGATEGPTAASTEALILRLDRSGSIAGSTLPLEGRSLRAVAGRIPVPAVVASGDDSSALGAPFLVLERVTGETIPRRILRDDEYLHARSVLVVQSAEALAAIHETDPGSIDGLDDADPLESWTTVLHEMASPHPALEIAARHLETTRPARPSRSLVHGDYRLGNLLVDHTGLRAVLDWELAHAGDPVEDLGWMCVRAWRFGSPLPALGLGSYGELLEAYEHASGTRFDEADLFWWETFGTWRWGVMCALMAEHGKASGNLTVELAAIGRRACENEWDVLGCLGRAGLAVAPSSPDPTPTAADPGAPVPAQLHDVPTAPELVAAVRRYLDETVRASTTGSVAYEARVATNVLAMVERELGTAVTDLAHQARLLASIGMESDAHLVAAICSGAIAYDDPVVLGIVAWEVAAKLAVANPAYPTDRDPPLREGA